MESKCIHKIWHVLYSTVLYNHWIQCPDIQKSNLHDTVQYVINAATQDEKGAIGSVKAQLYSTVNVSHRKQPYTWSGGSIKNITVVYRRSTDYTKPLCTHHDPTVQYSTVSTVQYYCTLPNDMIPYCGIPYHTGSCCQLANPCTNTSIVVADFTPSIGLPFLIQHHVALTKKGLHTFSPPTVLYKWLTSLVTLCTPHWTVPFLVTPSAAVCTLLLPLHIPPCHSLPPFSTSQAWSATLCYSHYPMRTLAAPCMCHALPLICQLPSYYLFNLVCYCRKRLVQCNLWNKNHLPVRKNKRKTFAV